MLAIILNQLKPLDKILYAHRDGRSICNTVTCRFMPQF